MTPLSRALAGALLVVSALAGSLVLTAGPAAAAAAQTVRVVQALGEGTEPSPRYTEADSAGLTYDQWRTGRLVFGVIGLTLMGFVAFRAFRAWWSRRRTTDDR